MNKNKFAGIALVVVAAVLMGVCASSLDDVAARYVGKAVWFLPYAALVTGIRRLAHA